MATKMSKWALDPDLIRILLDPYLMTFWIRIRNIDWVIGDQMFNADNYMTSSVISFLMKAKDLVKLSLYSSRSEINQ
jgi:hypothetical protein